MNSDEMVTNHQRQMEIIALADSAKRDLTKTEANELEELQSRYDHLAKCNTLRNRAEKIDDALTAPQGLASVGIVTNEEAMGGQLRDVDVRDLEESRRNGGNSLGQSSLSHLRRNGWRYREPARAIDRRELASDGFRDFGEFLRVVAASNKGISDNRLKRLSSMGESVGVDGGFAVPMRYSMELFSAVEMLAPYLSLRTNVDVQAGPSITFPTINNRDQSAGELAGFQMARSAESSTLAEDTVVLGSTQMNLSKAGKIVRVSNELLADAMVGTIDRIREVFAQALTLLQVDNLLNGTGAGEPLGITSAPATYSQSTSTASGKIDLLDVLNMTARLEPGDDSRAAWLAHPSVIPALGTMVSVASSSIEPTWTSSARDSSPKKLLGFPLHTCGACQQLDTPGDLMLCRLDRYVYASTQLRIDTDKSFKFGNDEVTFRITIRDDGSPIDSTTFTDLNGYTQAPFVKLAVRT